MVFLINFTYLIITFIRKYMLDSFSPFNSEVVEVVDAN